MTNPQSSIPNPQSPIPNPRLYACLFRSAITAASTPAADTLAAIAAQFSPRYECPGADLVSIDVSGLERLLGSPQAIGEELRREAAARGVRAHVAVASTRTAAIVLAVARPGVTVIAAGMERSALAPIAIGILDKSEVRSLKSEVLQTSDFELETLQRWGLTTLGDLAALPPADVAARLGRPALVLQAIARGEDVRPLVPTLPDERFDASLDLEWPIEELEPLSFVLTRLLEPLSLRLERRDRGAAVLHVVLRLVTREAYTRRLELPSPIRDVRTLRTLALLDLESHPPAAAIDRVTVVIDPTPGRVLQHTLFTRARPTPEQLSTLAARLGALIGQDRFGAPAVVDSHRPGACAMAAFKTDHDTLGRTDRTAGIQPSAISHRPLISALRRWRQPVPARVVVVDGRPARVTSDRRGCTGGTVIRFAGPWRTSGHWWAGEKSEVRSQKSEVEVQSSNLRLQTSDFKLQASGAAGAGPWNRDEWDVSLSDGAVYRIFRDRETDAWFIDAIVD